MMIMNDDTTQNGYFSSSSDLKREKRLLHFCKKGKSIHSKKNRQSLGSKKLDTKYCGTTTIKEQCVMFVCSKTNELHFKVKLFIYKYMA